MTSFCFFSQHCISSAAKELVKQRGYLGSASTQHKMQRSNRSNNNDYIESLHRSYLTEVDFYSCMHKERKQMLSRRKEGRKNNSLIRFFGKKEKDVPPNSFVSELLKISI